MVASLKKMEKVSPVAFYNRTRRQQLDSISAVEDRDLTV